MYDHVSRYGDLADMHRAMRAKDNKREKEPLLNTKSEDRVLAGNGIHDSLPGRTQQVIHRQKENTKGFKNTSSLFWPSQKVGTDSAKTQTPLFFNSFYQALLSGKKKSKAVATDVRKLKGLSLVKEIMRIANGITVEDPHEWDTIDVLAYMVFDNHAQLFKDLWLHDYRKVIKIAAAKFDIPAILLAGVAYTEAGGDPMWLDDLAYDVRAFDHMADPYLEPLTMTIDPDKTSFGYVSIQMRRARASLGLKKNWLNDILLKAMLKQPKTNIIIVAKHLSDLRDIDFPGKTASQFTDNDIIITGSRYWHGTDVSLAHVKQDLSYGKNIIRKKDKLSTLILDY